MDTLRDQLNLQKDSLQKYEGKIKRREAELKEKTQELRKLRAETANAKLQVDKGIATYMIINNVKLILQFLT